MFVNTKKNNKEKSVTFRVTEKQKEIIEIMCSDRGMDQTELILTLLDKEFVEKSLLRGNKNG